jgi:hypothetical protein
MLIADNLEHGPPFRHGAPEESLLNLLWQGVEPQPLLDAMSLVCLSFDDTWRSAANATMSSGPGRIRWICLSRA